MAESLSSDHLKTAAQHLAKVRDFLLPRTGWQLTDHSAPAMATLHADLSGLARAVQAVMQNNDIEAVLEGGGAAAAAPAADLDGEQLEKAAAFVAKMRAWFAPRAQMQVDSTGRGFLQRLFRLLLEALRAAELIMSRHGVDFEAFQLVEVEEESYAFDDESEEYEEYEDDDSEDEDLPDHLSRLCPKCGVPRMPGAEDCPACGVIYARAMQQAMDGDEERDDEYDDEYEDDEYEDEYEDDDDYDRRRRGSQPPPPPLPTTRLGKFRKAIDDDVWIFVVVAAALYLGVSVAISSFLVGGSESIRDCKQLFHDATSRKLRYPFATAISGNFVGHRIAAYSKPSEQLFLFLYYEGALAKKTSTEVLRDTAFEVIELMEVPLTVSETRNGHLGDNAVEIEVFEIADPQGTPQLGYLSIFENTRGRPVVVVLYGPRKEARNLAKEIFVDSANPSLQLEGFD